MKSFKNIYNLLLLLIVVVSLPSDVFGQQDSQYTQYMYNTISINPAYAGSRGVLSFTGLYRTQWVGLEGAPDTGTFSMNTPIGSKGVGLGLSIVSDKIGPSNENTFAIDFSYTIPVSEETKMSFGIKGGANLLNVDYTKLSIYDTFDPLYQNNIDNRLTPIVGVGGFLHNDKWYIGLSSPNLIKTEHYEDAQLTTAYERLHFYLTGGYVFDLTDNIKFKPAVMGKVVNGAPLALDLSANMLFNEKFTLGAAYRLDAAVSFMAGFQISEGLMIGYGYDLDTTGLGNYNSGSHEFILRYELFTKSKRIVSPRFF